jgi:hypothetical protein
LSRLSKRSSPKFDRASDCALPGPRPQHGSRLLRLRGARTAALFRSGDRTIQLLSTAGVLAAGILVPPFATGCSAAPPNSRLWFKPAGRGSWFAWYGTALCALALVASLSLPD